jgi:hypothetical protein
VGCALTCCHMSCSIGPCLSAKVDSRAATCPVAPDPASLQGRALMRHMSNSSEFCLPIGEGSGVPRVLRLWIMPSCKGELRCATCPTAPDPTSLQGRAPVCYVSYRSGSCLPTGEGSGVPCVLQLRILPSYRGGLWCATCPTALNPASL